MTSHLHLFQGYGVELEYMIVNKQSLKVNPICDEVIKSIEGNYTSDTEFENIGWSNEIVLHVIELKTPDPVKSLIGLESDFIKSVSKINDILKEYNSILLPSGSHPLMDPFTETKLWPHEHNDVYESYDRIFGCKGHGWSNLQSIHLNLPFSGDEEFGRLHSAIRLLLPLIPALTASSPILDGKFTGYKDMRLSVYQKNQNKIPIITGDIIPERAFTKADYEEIIFKNIFKEIAHYDTDNILQFEWLNSRGVIARFDRNAFEIRIIDIQEAPIVDVAIVFVIVETLKNLVNENWISYEKQKKWSEKTLASIFQKVIKDAELTTIDNFDYLKIFGIKEETSANNLWGKLIEGIDFSGYGNYKKIIDKIMTKGTLATRIINNLGNDLSQKNILSVYNKLANCLAGNKFFE